MPGHRTIKRAEVPNFRAIFDVQEAKLMMQWLQSIEIDPEDYAQGILMERIVKNLTAFLAVNREFQFLQTVPTVQAVKSNSTHEPTMAEFDLEMAKVERMMNDAKLMGGGEV
jgi:hypothetical protein